VGTNADNSEFTFHLRHNARFSNGDPITARDFVYTLRRAWPRAGRSRRVPGVLHQRRAAYNEGRGRAEDIGIQAIDDFTLKITLTQPLPFLTA
jgi:ABC-type oligopeptide transport system substrate-binding subunit